LLSQFTTFAASKDVPPNLRDINISGNLLLNQIKAYIVRNILGDSNYFPMLNKDDETVKKALEALRK
ncbi:MAG: S41 family peptidase, partial [Paludibacteraceae bacterium]